MSSILQQELEIGLIPDETNMAAPHSVPRNELHLLSENLGDMVELSQGDYPATSDPMETTLVESAHSMSRSPSSSRSTPPSASLVLISRV